MAGGEADGEDGLGRVDGLTEEVGCKREGADCVEHHIEVPADWSMGCVIYT